jgi:hypothetical protein
MSGPRENSQDTSEPSTVDERVKPGLEKSLGEKREGVEEMGVGRWGLGIGRDGRRGGKGVGGEGVGKA